MAQASSLFYSSDADKQTLHRRITPTNEQREMLQQRWQELRDHIVPHIEAASGYAVETWIQGSYKFGTLVRPCRKSDEFDVDLGLFLVWDPDEEAGPTPRRIRDWVQDALHSHKDETDDVTEVAEPPKERCGRIHYKESFHVDVPAYHLHDDTRRLATWTQGWEYTDPKAIYLWFKEQVGNPERHRLRRIVRYLKAWTALQFENERDRPSSVMITVVATEAYLEVEAAVADGDDDAFAATLAAIVARLRDSSEVANPVDNTENLNRLDPDAFEAWLSRVETLSDLAQRAVQASSESAAASLWADEFSYLFPIPDSATTLSKSANLPVAAIVPEIEVTVTAQDRGQFVGRYRNHVPPTPKDCDLRFQIVNPQVIPIDATIEWTVRNEGGEAENVNDLGHLKRGGRAMVVTESTAYHGRHFMDCVVKRHGLVIGWKRVPVQIQRHAYPTRAQPRPSYVWHR